MAGLELNFLAFAVPLFIALIGVEYWVSQRSSRPVHRFADSVTNLSVGVAERLFDLYTAGAFFAVYDFIQKHYGLFDIPANGYTFAVLFLATDLVWYWYHRLTHEINLFWGVHVVHHQSEEFNYTVSTRITVFQAILRGAFWAVLPLLGFSAELITLLLLIHGAYPFFTHTQLVGKLGWLEYVFVTPSHHRVHHASNERYLDKNYGDVLIVWDKLFGTFAPETEPPRYGLTKPLNSYSFLWQHFHYLLELGRAVWLTPGLGAKLRVLFGRPAQFDPSHREALEDYFLFPEPRLVMSARTRRYVLGQVVVVSVVLFFLILLEQSIPTGLGLGGGVVILLTLINIGAILEKKNWVFYLEYTRFAAVVLTLYAWNGQTVLLVLLNLASLAVLFAAAPLRRRYVQWVYR